jgi:branched-chain amino acid transport system substrate-binding protein
VNLTVSTLAPSAYPPAGQALLARFGPTADPYVLYGYEAMDLALDGVDAVGTGRRALTRWLFAVRDRDSVLGRYSMNRYGDISTRAYGVYQPRAGELAWAGPVEAPPRP